MKTEIAVTPSGLRVCRQQRKYRNPWGPRRGERRQPLAPACVVIGVLMAWPRDAVAGTLARIHQGADERHDDGSGVVRDSTEAGLL